MASVVHPDELQPHHADGGEVRVTFGSHNGSQRLRQIVVRLRPGQSHGGRMEHDQQAVLYVATGRVSFVVVGLLAFALGAWYLGTHIPHVHARVEDWLHPFNRRLYNSPLGSYQVANGNFAMAAGGLFG